MDNPVFSEPTPHFKQEEGNTGVVSDAATPGALVADATSVVVVPSLRVVAVEEGRVDPRTGELIDEPTPDETVVDPRPVVEDEAEGPVAVLTADDEWTDEELAASAEEDARNKAERKGVVVRSMRPISITHRDLAILEFLGRYRLATYPQIAGAFGTSYGALRRRMPRLAKEGLVVREKSTGSTTHDVWLPTETGLRLAGLDLKAPVLSWGTLAHTLGLVDLGIRFEALGETVVTEREIRAADTRDRPSQRMAAAMSHGGEGVIARPASVAEGKPDPLYTVKLGSGESHYGHVPDMVLVRPPSADGTAQSVAIELELNHKVAADWRKILTGYMKATNLSGVVYYTQSTGIRNGIIAAAKDVGATRFVLVRKFEQGGSAFRGPKN